MHRDQFIQKFRVTVVGLVIDILSVRDAEQRNRMIVSLPHRVQLLAHDVFDELLKGEKLVRDSGGKRAAV